MLINIYSSLRTASLGERALRPQWFGWTGLLHSAGRRLWRAACIWLADCQYCLCARADRPADRWSFSSARSSGGLVERRSDWKPESWGDFIMQNFFEVFEFLLSYATNTMSFLRVGAFVLVACGHDAGGVHSGGNDQRRRLCADRHHRQRVRDGPGGTCWSASKCSDLNSTRCSAVSSTGTAVHSTRLWSAGTPNAHRLRVPSLFAVMPFLCGPANINSKSAKISFGGI